jgi:PEP-CTERM motif
MEGVDDCRDFANWGGTAGNSYVVLYEADGHTISDYLWIDSTGEMTFESKLADGTFAELPPSGFVFLGGLMEDGTLQEMDQFFPGSPGSNRTLFIQSDVVEGTTPEPSTLLLFGPAAAFLFGRARRFWRS